MSSPRRLALLALLLGLSAPLPATAFAGGPAHHGSVRAADEDATAPDESDATDDPVAAAQAPLSNPFCLTDADPDGLDPADDVIEADPAYVEGDILDEEVGDEPIDLDGILDFCSDGAVGDKPAVGSLSRTIRGLSVPTDTMNISVPGTITRTLRLSKVGLPKALRPYRSLALGSARKTAQGDGFLDLSVNANKKGRAALRKARPGVKLVLESTQRLASGQERTRTQAIVLGR